MDPLHQAERPVAGPGRPGHLAGHRRGRVVPVGRWAAGGGHRPGSGTRLAAGLAFGQPAPAVDARVPVPEVAGRGLFAVAAVVLVLLTAIGVGGS